MSGRIIHQWYVCNVDVLFALSAEKILIYEHVPHEYVYILYKDNNNNNIQCTYLLVLT